MINYMDKEKQIKKVLTRGVENIYPSREELEKVLKSGKKIRLYNGIDPTGPTLHLGHLVQIMKLKQFQDLGHEVIVLIGDFTAQIGDPTDKKAVRQQLTHKQVMKNCQGYKKQIGKVLDLKKTKFKYNSEWLGKLSFAETLELSAHFTAQQTLARDMFKKRMQEGKDLYLHEFLYPLMQAYDSVFMDVDLEIGGKDQMFNMLAGRTLMKKMKDKEKYVMTTKLLEDPASGRKMGKTEGNIVALNEEPKEMFGKIMSWPDEMILIGFELLTDFNLDKAKQETEENPRDAKARLAREIVKIFHSEKQAEQAEKEFDKVFKEKEKPSKIPTYQTKKEKMKLVDLLVEAKLAPSRGEARRLIEQGAVKINDKKIKDWEEEITLKDNAIIQVGKRHFIQIKA